MIPILFKNIGDLIIFIIEGSDQRNIIITSWNFFLEICFLLSHLYSSTSKKLWLSLYMKVEELLNSHFVELNQNWKCSTAITKKAQSAFLCALRGKYIDFLAEKIHYFSNSFPVDIFAAKPLSSFCANMEYYVYRIMRI